MNEDPDRARQPTAPVRSVSREVSHVACSHVRFAPGLKLPRHAHERPIVAVFLGGAMEVAFASRTLLCAPRTVQVHPPGEPHSQRYDEQGAEMVVLEPDPAHDNGWRPLDDLLGRVAHFRHGRILELAARLRDELRRDDPLSSLAIEALALDILVTAARVPVNERLAPQRPHWFHQADELVHDCFRDKLRIGDVAREVGVHPAHLANAFRRTYHVPLATHIRRLRLQWAATRLRDGDAPLAQLAAEAGFSDQSHLTRAFKRYSGRTPGQYRAHARNGGKS